MPILLEERRGYPAEEKVGEENLQIPQDGSVAALFAFSARMDRDSMKLFAGTHHEVRAAAIVSNGREVLEQLQAGLRPQVLVLDALLTNPSITELLEKIGQLHLDPEPSVLVLVPMPEEAAARRALSLFTQWQIMLRPYGMKNLFEQVYRMGATAEEGRLYHLRGCCEQVLEEMGAPLTLNGYHYAERMLLYALYADRQITVGELQQCVAAEEGVEGRSITASIHRLSCGMAARGKPAYRELCLRSGRAEDAVLSNGQLIAGMLYRLREIVE